MDTMEGLNITIDDIDFISTNDTFLKTYKWLTFCKAVHVKHQNFTNLGISDKYYERLLDGAKREECLADQTFIHAIYWFSIIISILVIKSNLFIVLIFTRNRHLRTVPNIPMMSLACSDILIGIIFLYTSTWNHLILSSKSHLDAALHRFYSIKRSNFYLCMIFDGPVLIFISLMSSLLSLTLVAADRFVAVKFTYKYTSFMKRRHVVFAVVILWIVSFLAGMVPLFWNTYDGGVCNLTRLINFDYTWLWSTMCFVSAILIFYMYVQILRVAFRHSRQIGTQRMVVRQSSDTDRITLEDAESDGSKKSMEIPSKMSSSGKSEQSGQESGRTERSLIVHENDNHRCLKDDPSGKISDLELMEAVFPDHSVDSLAIYNISNDDATIGLDNPAFSQLDVDTKSDQKGIFKEKKILEEIRLRSAAFSESKFAEQWAVKHHKLMANLKDVASYIPSCKAIKTAGMILGTFYICWLPLLIYLLAYNGQYESDIVYCLAVLTQINSLANPLIYGLRQQDIRLAGRKMLTFWRKY